MEPSERKIRIFYAKVISSWRCCYSIASIYKCVHVTHTHTQYEYIRIRSICCEYSTRRLRLTTITTSKNTYRRRRRRRRRHHQQQRHFCYYLFGSTFLIFLLEYIAYAPVAAVAVIL